MKLTLLQYHDLLNDWVNWSKHDKQLRDSPCVYLLFKNQDLIYIGVTDNVQKRLYGHKEKNFTNVLVWSFNQKHQAKSVESFLIALFKPIKNQRGIFDDWKFLALKSFYSQLNE